jgi:hypothetical protein
MKYLTIIAFAAIIASMGVAFIAMMKPGTPGSPKSARMARALAVRVAISIVLFLLVLIAWGMGWIHPTGIAPGQ